MFIFEMLIGATNAVVLPMLLLVLATIIEVPITMKMKESVYK